MNEMCSWNRSRRDCCPAECIPKRDGLGGTSGTRLRHRSRHDSFHAFPLTQWSHPTHIRWHQPAEEVRAEGANRVQSRTDQFPTSPAGLACKTLARVTCGLAGVARGGKVNAIGVKSIFSMCLRDDHRLEQECPDAWKCKRMQDISISPRATERRLKPRFWEAGGASSRKNCRRRVRIWPIRD